ncbi:UDP-N-acetylmuramate dehydrogenase [Kitasatospora sp. NPDC089509]|uniref:UDP-N-acetylmuramate dehydrogenase n=1 Tax=Kitasatospora sp. NPDC089509 TaxID=3364079 RepID=UPI003817C0BB
MPQDTLASLTTLRLGGPAGTVLNISDPADWQDTVRAIGTQEHGPVILGHGSNAIGADAGHPGAVLVMNTRGIAVKTLDDMTVAVTVQAGHPLADLVQWAADGRLAGIECLAGIPGTVGATPVQNAGAYGQQIADTLDSVTVWDWDMGRPRTFPAPACRLRYRSSRFKEAPGRWTILTITLRLTRSQAAPISYRPLAKELDVPVGARPSVQEVTEAVLANRRRRGLLLDPDGPDARQAGSVFLNPLVTAAQAARWSAEACPVHRDSDGELRASAGWLLELVGCRPGEAIADGVRCSEHRTLSVVAYGEATAVGFGQALTDLAARVRTTTGITLQPEPVRVGQWAVETVRY